MIPEGPAYELPGEVRKRLQTGDDLAAGESLRTWGEALARSRPAAARAWAHTTQSDPWGSPRFAAFVGWTTGTMLHLVGEVKEAQGPLNAAIKDFRRLGEADLADRASLVLLDGLAERLELGRARRLAKNLEQRFSHRGDHQRAAAVVANLAGAEDASDHITTAINLWRRALIRLDPASPRHFLTRANLANAAALSGHLAEAIEAHGKVAQEAHDLGYEALVQQANLNLAEAEFGHGRVDDALARWHRVIEGAGRTGSPLIQCVAELDLAAAELALGLYEQAGQRLLVLRPVLLELGLEVERGRALRLEAVIAASFGRFGSWREAHTALRGRHRQLQRDLLLLDAAQLDPTCPALTIERAARRLLTHQHHLRGALGLAWAARNTLKNGRQLKAARLAREVLQLRRVSPWARMLAHHVLGRCGGPGSGRYLAHAVRWADQLHGRLATTDRDAFLALRGEVYLDRIAFLTDRGTSKDRRQALDLVARFRSGWLVDELAQRCDRSNDPLLARWQRQRCQLSDLLQRLEGDDEPRLRRSGLRLDSRVQTLESELRSLETTIARRRPSLSLRSSVASAEGLDSVLAPSDTVVELLLDRNDLVVFTIHGGQVLVRRHCGTAQQVSMLAASARFHLDRHPHIKPGRHRRRALDHTLERLSALIMTDVPASTGASLWIAPHGSLFQIPWPAMPGPSGRCLIDDWRLALVPGAGSLQALLAQPAIRPKTMAISGAPNGHLPLIATEIQDLAALLPTAEVVETATRESFIEALTAFDLVHLAGHAIFLDHLPSASGLRLADGFLTVHDLAATHFQTTLVSFGVCSGMRLASTEPRHHEGFLRSLLAGGVRTAIGAIAPVHDQHAYIFDLEFYSALKSTADPGEAYRRAVLALRAEDEHPAAWGAFHLFGDHRPWPDLEKS